MATVKDIVAQKGGVLRTIGPEATVLEAALLMNQHRIGCAVVIQGGRVQGIFTERDVLTRVVAQRRDPVTTRVLDVMTREVACASPEMPIEQARTVFRQRRIRHLPVVDAGGQILGLISIGDLNAWQSDAQEQQIHFLHEYIYGRV